MPAYPTIVDYNEVVQHPRTAFFDTILKSGTTETNALGLPKPISGGFALTYKVTSNGKKYAVRCFHRQVPFLEQRYEAISKCLSSLKSDYFVRFKFEERGILVRGQSYPIVSMDWVEGPTLGMYVEINYSSRSVLEDLRTRFQALGSYLESVSVAHGDLQNGNVILNRGSIKLVDYDGMYVPGMSGRGTETGHKHFQHPQRSINDIGPHTDRFSLIVIDLSLQAIALNGKLFNDHYNGENLLFTANDYADPESSTTLQSLLSLPQLKQSTQNFIAICRAAISETPSLVNFLAGREIPKVQIKVAAIRAGATPSASIQKVYIAAFPVIDAHNYALAEKNVGDKVELIGRIMEVTTSKTRYGKPYVFIKFGPGRNAITKINIWSEGLANFHTWPSLDIVGKWVSVTGLLDPYSSRRRPFYTNIGITINSPSELKFITEAEARYRLGAQGQSASRPSPTSNEGILRRIMGGGVTGTSQNQSTTNQRILAAIRQTAKQPSSRPSQPASTSIPTRGTAPSQGKKPSIWERIPGWLWWALIILVIYLLNKK